MKAYFINLDRSPERRDWFLGQAAALEIGFTRVPAVDSRELGEAEMARQRALASGDTELSPGEIACLLSHRKVWRLVAGASDPWAFIAEDDIHFAPDAARFLSTPEWIPAGAEVVKAETTLIRQELSRKVWAEPFGHELRQLRSNHFCSGGYFLSRDGAARLLGFTDRHVEPVDVILFSPELGVLNQTPVLQLSPAICLQDMYMARRDSRLDSDIHSERVSQRRSRKMPPIAKLRREAKRVAGQIVEPFRRLVAIGSGRSVFRTVPFGSNADA